MRLSQSLTRRSGRSLIIAAALMALPCATASAVLQPIAGPANTSPDGYRLATFQTFQVVAPTWVSNAGIAAGNAVPVSTPNLMNSVTGQRVFRWGPNLAPTPLPVAAGDGHDAVITVTGMTPGGTAVGIDAFQSNRYAVQWASTPLGTQTILPSVDDGLPNETNAAASAISPGGQFTTGRQYVNSNPGNRAVRFDNIAGTATALAPLVVGATGPAESVGNDVNDSGTVVGTSFLFTGGSGTRPVRWDPGSAVPVPLGILGMDASNISSAEAVAINNAGTIVGSVRKYETVNGVATNKGLRAVRWDAGSTVPVELGVLSGDGSAVTIVGTRAINENGVIIGSAGRENLGLASAAVKWTPGSTVPIQLPAPNNSTSYTAPLAINKMGAVVGNQGGPIVAGGSSSSAALLWTPDNTVIRLDSLIAPGSGWQSLVEASGISDTGWVSGFGVFDPDGVGTGLSGYARLFSMLVPQAGTYGLGDADFDTDVDFADLLVLAKNYGKPSSGSVNAADFDLNGVTDFDDLLTLARNYSSPPTAALAASTSNAFAADFALAQSLVPEPAMLAFGALMLPALCRRR